MFDWHAISVAGSASPNNDDYAQGEPSIGAFVIADGMGGRPAGACASRVAAESFVSSLAQTPPRKRLESAALQDAVSVANRDVRAASNSDPELEGLGTTLSAVVMNGRIGKVVHVGDSRVYIHRNGHLHQLTRDHTLTAELVQRQHLSAEAAKHHPLRHWLSRSIGTAENVAPELYEINIAQDDWLILATDGLAKCVSTDELNGACLGSLRLTAKEVCRRIMTLATDRQPADDVTTLVLRVIGGDA